MLHDALIFGLGSLCGTIALLAMQAPAASWRATVMGELVESLQQLVTDYEDVPDATDADGQAVFERARAALKLARQL